MTKIKFCGLTRKEDIESANELMPEYIGFVFAKKSKRYIAPREAADLKKMLDSEIKAVGVFVDEEIDEVASLLKEDVIDAAQLHGHEDEEYIGQLRKKLFSMKSDKEIIKAFVIKGRDDPERAKKSTADIILLDAGYGNGDTFDWDILKGFDRPYFLAGGLNTENVSAAVSKLKPYGVDVSSGIETDGVKDAEKMRAFIYGIRSF